MTRNPSNDAVAAAEKLLGEGRAADARDLLLAEGFSLRLDTSVQEAFFRLFPPTPALAAYLEGPVRLLQSADVEERRRAARTIRVDSMKGYSIEKQEWLGDPRTTGQLIRALADPDPKVVEESVGALSEVVSRYFPDQRAVPELIRLLRAPKKDVRFFAVRSLGYLRGRERWEALVPLLHDRIDKVRVEVYGAAYHAHALQRMTPAERSFVLRTFVQGLDDPDKRLRVIAASTLLSLVRDTESAPMVEALPQYVESEPDPRVREGLMAAIHALPHDEEP